MENKELDTIGGRLKAWRKHLDLTGVQFAEMVGLHVGMIRKYETNAAVPGGETLIDLSKTGVNIQWLLLGEGEMCIDPEAATRETSILKMLDELDSVKRDALLSEFFTRIQDAKQIEELKGVVDRLIKQSAA